MDSGGLERLIRRRDGPARLVVKVPVAPALGILIEAEQAHRKFLRDEHPIVVGLVTRVAPRAKQRLERGAVAREVGLLAAEGDEAASLAEAEKDGVGSTRNLSALDVVEIDGDARLDEIARGTGGRAAHPEIEIVAVGPAAGGVVEARVRVLDVDLDVGRVRKHLLEVGRGDVGEKLGRERGDGGGRVLEPGVEARSARGVAGLVTGVVLGAHFEERELDGRGIFRARRGSRCRSSGYRRGLRPRGDGKNSEQTRDYGEARSGQQTESWLDHGRRRWWCYAEGRAEALHREEQNPRAASRARLQAALSPL